MTWRRGWRLGLRPGALALAALALTGCSTGPVEVAVPEVDADTAAVCADLMAGVPESVADQPAREVTDPERVAAWGDPAIVLTCGVEPDPDFDELAACTIVEDVEWYVPEDPAGEGEDVSITLVNRAVTARLELPAEYLPPATALADLAASVAAAVPATGGC